MINITSSHLSLSLADCLTGGLSNLCCSPAIALSTLIDAYSTSVGRPTGLLARSSRPRLIVPESGSWFATIWFSGNVTYSSWTDDPVSLTAKKPPLNSYLKKLKKKSSE